MNNTELKVVAGGRVIDPVSKLDCIADIYIENGKVNHWQVTLKVGFTLDD